MSQLLITDLKKSYEVNNAPYKVLKGLTCTFNGSHITVVLGKSGCGKTTLLRLLCGLEKPDQGTIENPERLKIGMMFQEARLMPWLTCEENITIGLEKTYDKSKVASLINMVGLGAFAGSYPNQLSGGMQQRTALARTLATDSDLILMDEPFAALDYFTRQTMQKEVLRIAKLSQKGIIFVTHNIDEALLLADRILILRDGLIAQDFSLSGQRPRDLLTEEYIVIKRQILKTLQIN